MTFKTKSLVSLAVLALLTSACSMESETTQQGFNENPKAAQKVDLSDSQKLLAAEGTWHFVEETPVSDPLDKHMSARGKVDPASQRRGHNDYTDKVKDMHVTEEVHFRVLRLERQVADLQTNFDRLLPPLSNLIVSDEQLDRVISNIQKRQMELGAENQARVGGAGTLTDTAAGNVPVQTDFTKVPVKEASLNGAQMSDVSGPSSIPSGSAQVQRLRMGEHPGKTRLVLDLNGPSQFSTNVDNAENLLLVNLPNTGWNAQMDKTLGAHPLIKSYSATPSGNGGTTLILQLKKPARVLSSFALGPKGGHRIVLDLASL